MDYKGDALDKEYDFKDITNKYFLNDSIVLLVFKNKNEVRTLSRITINDEVSNLTTAVSSINFVGSGVTAATDWYDVTATIVGADLTNVFDEDGNGDIQPSDTCEGISVFYEYDDNNDIIPRT